MKEFSDEIVLKNHPLNVSDILPIFVIFFAIHLGIKHLSDPLILIMIGASLCGITYTSVKLFRRKAQIIINKKGIVLCGENRFFAWNDIEYAYYKHSGTGILCIITKTDEVNVLLNKVKISKERLSDAITFYSGRLIDENAFLQRKIEKDYNNLKNDIVSKFEAVVKKQALMFFLTFFPIVILSFILQIKSNLPFLGAIGLIVSTYVFYRSCGYLENNLRKCEIISQMSDNDYLDLAYRFGVKPKPKVTKYFLIFWSIVVLTTFLISTLVMYN